MKKDASNNTYLTTVGLLHLAKDHYHQLKSIEKTLCTLLDQEEGGHISDAIWGEMHSPEKLFELLEIGINKDSLYDDNRIPSPPKEKI